MTRVLGRRDAAGITLLEVLVALFVAGVGLLSLLALFPTALQNMSQAVQDNRSGHVQQSAATLADSVSDTTAGISDFVAQLETGKFDAGLLPPLLEALGAEEEEAARLAAEVQAQAQLAVDVGERASLHEDLAAIRFLQHLLHSTSQRLALIARLLSLAGVL